MNNEQNKEAIIIRFTDQTLRCSNCNQLLHEEQKICPNCNSALTSEQKINKLDETKDIYYKGYSSFLNINDKQTVFQRKNLSGFFILLFVLFLSFSIASVLNDVISPKLTKVIGWFNSNSQSSENYAQGDYYHSEVPLGDDSIEAYSYGFKINQMFFQGKESDYNLAAIKDFFTQNNIGYINLHYTDSGYYTADLTDYEETTREEYEAQTAALDDMFISWCESYTKACDIEYYSIQGSYHYFK